MPKEHDQALRLRNAIAHALQSDFGGALDLPSQLDTAQVGFYRTLFDLILDSDLLPVQSASDLRNALADFQDRLAHRQQVTTWDYNGKWFAALSEGDHDTAQIGTTESEALEKLYALYPDRR